MSQNAQVQSDDGLVLLRTTSLTHHYGTHPAVQDLNLTVHAGEVFGYIGPNGAGKTTTFRMLCGLLRPTAGRAFVSGHDVTHDQDRIKQLVGYLPDNFGIYPMLRVWEYLDFFAAAYKVPRKLRAHRIETCLRIANAQEYRDKLMGALSRGMKQRVGIAKTLLHDPAVVILDEPAATLDPRARVQMRQLLRELAALGKAVLVSSHILPELASVCDTVGFLMEGRMVACGPVQQIMQTVRQTRVIEIRTLGDNDDRVHELLTSDEDGSWKPLLDQPRTLHPNATLRYQVEADETQLSHALARLLREGVEVVSFSEVPPNLEDAFMMLTQST